MFEIKKEKKTVCLLDGVYEGNTRSNETFNKVEAVSFPDYNSDGFNDIIIICSYSPASGPKTGTGYPEVRIYSGKADGSFTLERSLSENANSALAEKTVQSVLGFLGAGKGRPSVSASGWQQAYTGLLQSCLLYTSLLDVVFGGFLYGLSIAIALRGNASTGGTDFIALYVSNKTGRSIWEYVFAGNCVILCIFGYMFGWL